MKTNYLLSAWVISTYLLFVALVENTSAQNGSELVFASDRTGRFQIWKIQTNPLGTPGQLTTAGSGSQESRGPSWSQEAKLAYQFGASGVRGIHIVNPDGSSDVEVTTNISDEVDATWSPDGQFIAYSFLTGGNYDIWIHKVGDPNTTSDDEDYAFFTSTGQDNRPAWSPDGTKIAFASTFNGGGAEIAVATIVPDPSHLGRIKVGSTIFLTSNSSTAFDPTWSPDGESIAFSSTRTGTRDIYRMSSIGGEADTNNFIRLTMNSASDSNPSWSPDGTKIAFVTDRDGNREIYVMSATLGETDANTFKRITNDAGRDDDPAWEPTPCQLNIGASFKQADASNPNVPAYFGYSSGDNTGSCSESATGRAKTSCFGCALCSLATMLTAFNGLQSMTPSSLDASLKSVNGYTPRAFVDWCKIGKATGRPIGLVDSGAHTDSDIDAYLSEHLCGHGDGVILEMNQFTNGIYKGRHFILATGKSSGDWTVFDPGWQTATDYPERLGTLKGHQSGFTAGGVLRTFSVAGVRTYRKSSSSTAKLCVRGHSPIELLIIDPSGKRVGWDGTNDVAEIPQASYVRDYPIVSPEDPGATEGEATGIKTLLLPAPINGIYTIVSTGTGSGAYTLEIEAEFSNGSIQSTAYSGTASAGTRFTNLFTVVLPIPLSVQNSGNQVILNWTNAAFGLQSGPAATGAFTNIPGATSPYTNPVTGKQQFFRLISN